MESRSDSVYERVRCRNLEYWSRELSGSSMTKILTLTRSSLSPSYLFLILIVRVYLGRLFGDFIRERPSLPEYRVRRMFTARLSHLDRL